MKPSTPFFETPELSFSTDLKMLVAAEGGVYGTNYKTAEVLFQEERVQGACPRKLSVAKDKGNRS